MVEKQKAKKEVDIFGDETEEQIDDLPEPQEPAEASAEKLVPDVGRFCAKCGKEARLVSNFNGRHAYCGPCGIDWPLGPPMATIGLPTQGRGLAKQTLVQPNWDLAFDDIDPTGPK